MINRYLATMTVIFMAFTLLAAAGCGSDGGTPTLDNMPNVDAAVDAMGDPGAKTDDKVVPDSTVVETYEDTVIDVPEEDNPVTDTVPDVDTGPGPGEFGWPCTDGHLDCLSGFCVPSDQGNVCTIVCYEECPPGWTCSLFQPTGMDPVFICLQTSTNLCRPCMTDEQCSEGASGIPGSRCIEFGLFEGSFCGLLCAENKDCPDEYSCLDVETGREDETVKQCLPDSGLCECSPYAIQLGAKTACYQGDDNGMCEGERVCAADGLTACSAPAPTAEVCDAVDNDCDGDTDEGVDQEPCTVSNPHGECPGWSECVDGVPVCDAPEPAPEECDGKDNDCDGTTDNDFDDTDQDGTADCIDPDDDDDGVEDIKDNCQFVHNPNQENYDYDSWGDVCDDDDDNDEIPDGEDNCPHAQNPLQENADGDAMGDACDPDDDNDNVFDTVDNCPLVYNPSQVDEDADGKGDACDGDADGDGIPDDDDNCPFVHNPNQEDLDEDGQGDVCDIDDDGDGLPDAADNCPKVFNDDQIDTDLDDVGDACDEDDDNDGVADIVDNCQKVANPGQADMDDDNIGNACDGDIDGDGIDNGPDNCPENDNPLQEDFDEDGVGDACDNDDDNDGVPDTSDNCHFVANPGQEDMDEDDKGDVCDNDKDGDGVPNVSDNCPDDNNPGQGDMDGDELGDACDPDKDGDGVVNEGDNCEIVSNPNQEDNDQDGLGDACDDDDDNDGLPDLQDNCQFVANDDQANADGDDFGDLCDDDDDNDGVLDVDDNCPKVPNGDQENFDSDLMGDACDPDDDNDGSLDGSDCDPFNAAVHPGAQEVCNGIDDNCVSGIDEEGAAGCDTWHYDSDDDGYGTSETKCLCQAAGLYRADKGGDCDDSASEINPGAVEKCNGVDDDCDGATDPEGSQGAVTYYRDHDGDGYGISGDSKALCSAAGEYTAGQGGDCNDNDGDIHPNATETCNGKDDNCTGGTDEEDSQGCDNVFYDGDGDNYGLDPSKCFCPSNTPSGWTADQGGDCCDIDASAKPGQGDWYTSANNCGSWDYDCANGGQPHWTGTASCGGWPLCGGANAWVGGEASCGQTKKWQTGCSIDWFVCSASTENRTQECH